MTLFDRLDPAPVLRALEGTPINYSADEVSEDSWNFDVWRSPLPAEAAGPPDRGGSWETACRLVEAYEFSDPNRIRAVFAADAPLLGRTMLLEGRFSLLRFYMGTRVTQVIDEERECGGTASPTGCSTDRVWGWAYETLEGHLERGRMSYEVVKHLGTGSCEFVITAQSQGAPSLGPVLTLGWRLFGRRTQVRFYRHCGARLNRAVLAYDTSGRGIVPRADGTDLVLAPSTARRRWYHRLAVRRHQPG